MLFVIDYGKGGEAMQRLILLVFVFSLVIPMSSSIVDVDNNYPISKVEFSIHDLTPDHDLFDTSIFQAPLYAHGGGLNSCGCHFNRKTGECHCHRDWGCGCECESGSC